MLILASPFTRNLVFFGVIDAILATFGLFGFTKVISSGNSVKTRIMGVMIIIVVLILLIVNNLLAIHFTLK